MTDERHASGTWDPTWEHVFRSQAWGKYPAEHVVRFVARRWYGAKDRRAVRLLDLGSGPGATTWFAAREGFDVSAVDGSPTAITQLRERLAREALSVDARVGDLASLPWPDAHFDGVIDNASMYANPFEACTRIVAEVRRVLKPGGHFLSASFTDRTWGWGLGRMTEPGGFADIPEGPFAGRGFSLLMGRGQVDELFAEFHSVTVDRLAHTVDGGAHQVEQWIVTCER